MDKVNPFRNSEKDELVNAVRAVLSGQEYTAPEKEVEEGKVVFDDHDADDKDFIKLIKKHGLKAKSDGSDTTVTGSPDKIEKVLQTMYGNDWKDMYTRKGQNFENFAGKEVKEHKGDKPHKHPHEEMDPVDQKAAKKKFKDRKDKDIDNDGDVDDSDKFLHKRRKAIATKEAKQKPYVSSDRDGKHVMNASGKIVKSFKDMDSANAYLKKNYNKLMKEAVEDNPANYQHLCAKNVVHEKWGAGDCIPTMHADPDEEGNVAWYDVMFEHGIEAKVSIDELKVTKAEEHMHASVDKKKKMKKEMSHGDKKKMKKDEVDTKPNTGDDRGTAE